MAASSKGQAIFEFIIFLPLILIFYVIIIEVASSINGSINQQKSTRGFTYGFIKGDSTIPIRRLVQENSKRHQVRLQGMFVYLYAEKLRGAGEDSSEPYATCYSVPSLGQGDPEECERPLEASDDSSPWIRVKTGYGLCGETYQINVDQNDQIGPAPFASATEKGCLASTGP